MRIFASDRVAGLMRRFGMQENEALEHSLVNRAIESAQRKVEGHNFDIRKNLLEFDDVANDQRKVIYQQRNELMTADDISETIRAIMKDVVMAVIDKYIPPQSLEEQWDIAGLTKEIEQDFGLELNIKHWLETEETLDEERLRQRILEKITDVYQQKETQTGPVVMRQLEKSIMLQVLDQHWKEHLAAMDHLRQGIHLRGYAQKNPTQEYKREAFEMFSSLLDSLKATVISTICTIQLQAQDDVQAFEEQRRRATAPQQQLEFQHAAAGAIVAEESDVAIAEQPGVSTYMRNAPKIGRNDPCPCGSGKKYKQCHGRLV